MRYAIISDIHGNLEALQSVLKLIQKERIDQIVCLGDVVGYGANPNECIDSVEKVAQIKLAGNHDYACLGKLSTDNFNFYAKVVVEWTIRQLKSSSRKWLDVLPLTYAFSDFNTFHATPKNPEQWNYINTLEDAKDNFTFFKDRICFIGHTHIPLSIIQNSQGQCKILRENHFTINQANRYIINVGSVGQPRDRDPRAAFGIYDSERQEYGLMRADYDIVTAQQKIIDAQLPLFLAERIAEGK